MPAKKMKGVKCSNCGSEEMYSDKDEKPQNSTTFCDICGFVIPEKKEIVNNPLVSDSEIA